LTGIRFSAVFLFLLASSVSPDTADQNKSIGSVGTTASSLMINGYTQVRYRSDEANETFDCRRARLALKGNLSPHMSFKLQTELSGSSQKLLDAELMFTIHPAIRFSAGQFKIPLSHENNLSSSDLKTINRSQVTEALTARSKDVAGNQNGRDIGIKLTGEMIQFGDFKLIEYTVGFCNGSGINTADRNTQKDGAGRIVVHPRKNIGLGGSLYSGHFTSSDAKGLTTDRSRQGIELFADWTLLSIRSEYLRGKDDKIKKDGWFVTTCIPLIQGKMEAVLRYDTFDPDIEVTGNSKSFYTFGINIPLDKRSKIQVNYEMQEESEKSGNSLSIQLQAGF
jgi:phosphate-selective porin OprO/OprP